jgi:D-tyrosyl-tRNA(Tyr) deacylase
LSPTSERRAGGRVAPAPTAEPFYERCCAALGEVGVPLATGVFGALMAVELVNDGPVTIVLDT